MNDEVRDMIDRALDGEPPVRLDYDTVRAAGRRRLARRNLGIAGGTALGVVAVAAIAVTAGQFVAGPAQNAPAGPASSSTAVTTTVSAPPSTKPASPMVPVHEDPKVCPLHQPDALPRDWLDEADRLTQAFADVAIPLPSGVTMDPVHPKFCASVMELGADFELNTPAGQRGVLIQVYPPGQALPGGCSTHNSTSTCTERTLPGGGTATITVTPPYRSVDPTIVQVEVRRPDGIVVALNESGREELHPAPRVFSDDQLIAIASAPEFTISVSPPSWEQPPPPTIAQGGRNADGSVTITLPSR